MCSVSVGVLGDISRALEDAIYPYCDGIMQTLLQNLQSEDVQRTIKPMILACFSDIALAINDNFEKYLPHVLTMLQSAQVGSPEAFWSPVLPPLFCVAHWYSLLNQRLPKPGGNMFNKLAATNSVHHSASPPP